LTLAKGAGHRAARGTGLPAKKKEKIKILKNSSDFLIHYWQSYEFFTIFLIFLFSLCSAMPRLFG